MKVRISLNIRMILKFNESLMIRLYGFPFVILLIFMFNNMNVKIILILHPLIIWHIFAWYLYILIQIYQLFFWILEWGTELFWVHCLNWDPVIKWNVVRRKHCIWTFFVLVWWNCLRRTLWCSLTNVKNHVFSSGFTFWLNIFGIKFLRFKNWSHKTFITCLIVPCFFNTGRNKVIVS